MLIIILKKIILESNDDAAEEPQENVLNNADDRQSINRSLFVYKNTNDLINCKILSISVKGNNAKKS